MIHVHIMVLELAHPCKVLVVWKGLRQRFKIKQLIVFEEVSHLGVLESKYAEESKKVTHFLSQLEVLAPDVEKLLKSEQDKKHRQNRLVSEDRDSEPKEDPASDKPKDEAGILFNLILVRLREMLIRVKPSMTVGTLFYSFTLVID